MRRKAVRALAEHTATVIEELKNDEDEMLRGRSGQILFCMHNRVHFVLFFMHNRAFEPHLARRAVVHEPGTHVQVRFSRRFLHQSFKKVKEFTIPVKILILST
jgi:hypothetical protein